MDYENESKENDNADRSKKDVEETNNVQNGNPVSDDQQTEKAFDFPKNKAFDENDITEDLIRRYKTNQWIDDVKKTKDAFADSSTNKRKTRTITQTDNHVTYLSSNNELLTQTTVFYATLGVAGIILIFISAYCCNRQDKQKAAKLRRLHRQKHELIRAINVDNHECCKLNQMLSQMNSTNQQGVAPITECEEKNMMLQSAIKNYQKTTALNYQPPPQTAHESTYQAYQTYLTHSPPPDIGKASYYHYNTIPPTNLRSYPQSAYPPASSPHYPYSHSQSYVLNSNMNNDTTRNNNNNNNMESVNTNHNNNYKYDDYELMKTYQSKKDQSPNRKKSVSLSQSIYKLSSAIFSGLKSVKKVFSNKQLDYMGNYRDQSELLLPRMKQ